MGSADRKMHRAVEALDRTYASALQPHRMDLARHRAAIDEAGIDEAGGDRSAVIAAVSALHDGALRAALGAANAQGGPGWMARAGTDVARSSVRLWSEHIAPFTGIDAAEVPGITDDRAR
ncbi:MAG: hypothetical protein AB7V43_21865 [Acidimicrobiia bacterium]